MKAIIVEDEPLVREDLHYLLREHPDIQVIAEAGTVSGAGRILTELQADVIFLDIQLLGGTGFDLVPLIPAGTPIIFFTSYDEFAVRAFEINALDYLLKPVSADRLATSLDRLRNRAPGQPPARPPLGNLTEHDRVFLCSDKERRFVPVREVLAVTAAGGNYSFVHLTQDRNFMVRRAMKAWEKMLPGSLFLRIHRSSIINLGAITSVRKTQGASYLLVLNGVEKPFTVSKRSVSRLLKCLPT